MRSVPLTKMVRVGPLGLDVRPERVGRTATQMRFHAVGGR